MGSAGGNTGHVNTVEKVDLKDVPPSSGRFRHFFFGARQQTAVSLSVRALLRMYIGNKARLRLPSGRLCSYTPGLIAPAFIPESS